MLNLNKPMATRDGKPVRYLGRIVSEFPLVFALQLYPGTESVVRRCDDGKATRNRENCLDVINIPEVVKDYQNVYSRSGANARWWPTLTEARQYAVESRDPLCVVERQTVDGKVADVSVCYVYSQG